MTEKQHERHRGTRTPGSWPGQRQSATPRLAGTGLIAALAAVLITTLTAALAQAAGVVTTLARLGLHLIPAAVMIPALTWSLRIRTD